MFVDRGLLRWGSSLVVLLYESQENEGEYSLNP